MTHITIQREADARGWWPKISPHLARIIEKAPSYVDYELRNILGELLLHPQTTRLYTVWVDDEWVGFLIGQIQQEEFTFNKIFLVWQAWMRPVPGLLKSLNDFLDEEAARLKCRYIRFWTYRPGWEKYLKKFPDWEKWVTIYQKKTGERYEFGRTKRKINPYPDH